MARATSGARDTIRNAYVVVYRDGPRRGSAHASPFHRTALPREGTSTFDALPPGDYFAVALSTQAAFGEFDADAVERLRALGTRFSIREGENKGITVGAIPGGGGRPTRTWTTYTGVAAPARRGTGSLRGRVVDATSGAPLRDADVTISQDKADTMRSAATDADGRYEFQDLPDGSYRVTAAKSGFDRLTYGERPPVRDETLVEVGGGRGVPVIDLRLQRQCALAGRVVDELGEPVSRAEVAIQRRDERDDGTPYPIEEGNTWTNDLGQFRIPGLSAGQYFLVAGLPTLVPDDVEDGERAKRVATYYPGTTEPAAAQPIRLAPGQTAEVTIELARPIRTVRISGRVVDAAGQPPGPGAYVGLVAVEPWSRVPYRRVPLRSDGTFTAAGVLPGAYALDADLHAADGRPEERGRALTTIAGSDVSGIVVRTSRGATLSGRVVFEGASVPPAGTTRIAAVATRVDPTGPLLAPRACRVGRHLHLGAALHRVPDPRGRAARLDAQGGASQRPGRHRHAGDVRRPGDDHRRRESCSRTASPISMSACRPTRDSGPTARTWSSTRTTPASGGWSSRGTCGRHGCRKGRR